MSLLPEIITTPEGFSVEGASPDLLRELLDRFASTTARLGAPIEDYLNPGISEAEIEDSLGKVGLVPPDELVAWWGWHNGTAPGRNLPLSLDLRSLEISLELYRRQIFGPNQWEWQRSWIPIVGNDPAGIAIDCSAPRDRPPLVRPVNGSIGTHPDDSDRQAVSLCTVVTWWLLARENGWTYVSADKNFWDVDRSAFRVDWWNVGLAYY